MLKLKNLKLAKGFIQQQKSGAGFTLIELMVVIGIMSMITGLIILDFSRVRPERDLNIAQNELITNLRKVQSYSLFSRNVGSLKPAQHYILKFSTTASNTYQVQAITDLNTSPTLNGIESIKLPSRVFVSALTLTGPIWSSPGVSASCALVAFKAPFARTYMSNGCAQTSPPFSVGDDYKKITDHVNNIAGATVSTNADLLITLSLAGSSSIRKILVKGVTGLVCTTANGTTCGN
jgi:prepilin-type N-terminal cleavage/methylation domain-containing protein